MSRMFGFRSICKYLSEEILLETVLRPPMLCALLRPEGGCRAGTGTRFPGAWSRTAPQFEQEVTISFILLLLICG